VSDIGLDSDYVFVHLKKLLSYRKLDELFPKRGNEMLPRAFGQIFQYILFDLDELIALGLQVDDDVPLVPAGLVTHPDEQGSLSRSFATYNKIDLAP
jgi:hypothetical protein